MNAVTHLKLGKFDGSEGLFSDHYSETICIFINFVYTISVS